MREALKSLLISAARGGRPLNYVDVANALALQPPHTIHRASLLIEDLMRHQAASDEPQLASFVVSKARPGLPAPGFFELARKLGLYEGRDDEPDAKAFVENERARCAQIYSSSE
ncbi:MAG: hypothetical protein AAFR88_10465 [Pseudomonadota bacterium]